jgi:hypothetical protein
MARTTPAGARAELFATLPTTGDRLVSGDHNVRVYEYELKSMEFPALTIFLRRTDARFWTFAVKLWVSAASDGAAAQAAVDDLQPVIEARLGDGFGPENWDIGWDETLTMIVATAEWQCVRGDL